jgi:DNA sulfur modification protein DndD
MQITRFITKNYRTYLDLDIDLTVEDDRPIILIGGANGGGKTTLFNAIHGALYGLSINTAEQFKREVNAGILINGEDAHSMQILLEIHFSGMVLSQKQNYILSRTWELVGETVRSSVILNMNGNIIRYGSATPDKERQSSVLQVNKIIKANLPQELSEYFLFDAMKAGEKLSDTQLSRVIRENIEIVMGFRKYLDLARAAERVRESKAADRIKQKSERDEYQKLVEDRRQEIEALTQLKLEKRETLDQIHSLGEFVAELKKAQNQETVLKNRRDQLSSQKNELLDKERRYVESLKEFVKDIAISTGLTQLAKSVRNEVSKILADIEDVTDGQNNVSRESTIVVIDKVMTILSPVLRGENIPSRDALIDAVFTDNGRSGSVNPWGFLDSTETNALRELIASPRINSFTTLDFIRNELDTTLPQVGRMQQQIEDIEAQMAGKDYSTLKRYEEMVNKDSKLQREIDNLEGDITEKNKRLQRFDIQIQEEPDPKFEALCRLVKYFEESADELLRAKKHQLEERMRDDLNVNLAAYRGVIERVELSENLRNLSFKLFHKAGNEIYLDQLNAASKQVVVQVLLKALHEYGDYDPPVMIDTVMGVLDKESRATVLEHYFPSLSHQTILLSTDSEIDPEHDLGKVSVFVSRSYTLIRDKEAQMTKVEPNYFGVTVEEMV